MHRCSDCLGSSNLSNYIESLFTADDTDADDVIRCKQWYHDGQLKLASMQFK